MTPRTLQCKVFWALLLNPKHSGVPEDSKSPTLGVLGFTPTLGQSGVATARNENLKHYVRAYSELMLEIRHMHELDRVCQFVMGLPTWAKRKLKESWPASLSEAITKLENLSDVGWSDKSGFKKDNKFLHKKPRHEGEWNWGQGSPTKEKPKQFQSSGFKPKGGFVKKGAPLKGSQPKGDFGAKPKRACFNCNEVG